MFMGSRGGTVRVLVDSGATFTVDLVRVSSGLRPTVYTDESMVATRTLPLVITSDAGFYVESEDDYDLSVLANGVEVADTPDGTRRLSLRGGGSTTVRPSLDVGRFPAAGLVPDLPASKITSGTLAEARLPSYASQASLSATYAPVGRWQAEDGNGPIGPTGINLALGYAAAYGPPSDVSGIVIASGADGRENIVGGDETQVNTANTNVPAGGPAPGTGADYAAVLAGYDNVVNGLAGIIAAYHAYIKQAATHGLILGGSIHHIDNGDYQAIVGGTGNSITSSGDKNTIIGGTGNVISGTGDGGVIFGGQNNSVTAAHGIASGFTCVASGSRAVALGHRCEAAGEYSSAIGQYAKARLHGQQSTSGGQFTAAGDAQSSVLSLIKLTTDGAQGSMTLDAAGALLPVMPDNTTWKYTAEIVGRTSGGTDKAAYEVKGVISRGVGVATTTLNGTPTTTTLFESDATWDATAQADTSGGSLKVRVQGAAGKTIRWAARLTLVEITF